MYIEMKENKPLSSRPEATINNFLGINNQEYE